MEMHAPSEAGNGPAQMRESAIDLARLGYHVFRLEPGGKVPIEKNFPAIASNDPAVVKAMWTDAVGDPTNHNIGIAMGKGYVAIDYDTKGNKPGLAARDEHLRDGMPTSIRMATPTGGEHLVLKTPDKLILGSSVERIAPGVDTRGRNSYIVGPGSVIETDGEPRRYEWIHRKPINEADPVPAFFLPKLLQHSRYSDTPSHTQPLCDLDEPSTIARAVRYLTDNAPEAIEGAGGDHTTYRVAAQLAEFGVSEDFALDLMLEHWNEQKAAPPWQPDELRRKVHNAYKYNTAGTGASSALADFEPVEIDETAFGHANTIADDPDWPKPTQIAPFEPSDLPDREFLFTEGLFAKRTVTAVVAPSGAGKTQWLIQAALGLATNQAIAGLTPAKRSRTWLWNQEDDETELKRRLLASMLHTDTSFDEINNRIAMNSGVDHRLTLVAKGKHGSLRATKHVSRIIQQLIRTRADAFIVDPLVEFHEAEENDNVQMAFVAGVLRRIAVEADVAVIVGHHDRKPDTASSDGHVGNQNAMRGASSLQGVTRAILTLYTMSDKDAKLHSIPSDQKHRYVRLDGAKNNLGLAGGAPMWFERTGQKLAFDGGKGQEVGVLASVDLSKRAVIKEGARVDMVLSALERAGQRRGSWVLASRLTELLIDARAGRKQEQVRSWSVWLEAQEGGSVTGLKGTIEVSRKQKVLRVRSVIFDAENRVEKYPFLE